MSISESFITEDIISDEKLERRLAFEKKKLRNRNSRLKEYSSPSKKYRYSQFTEDDEDEY